MTRRLYLLRHGQTDHNATRRMQGQLDTHLSEAGLEGAHRVAEMLEGREISKVIASDLSRAADTARVVGERIGVEVTIDPRLRETHLGEWQDMHHDEVDVRYPGARVYWRHDPTWAPPGGESRIQVAQRARRVIDELMATFDDWNNSAVLVVAHGGTISALAGSLLGFSTPMFPLLGSLSNTHFAVLSARPAFNPAVESAESLSPDFAPGGGTSAQWYLNGWNIGLGDI
ncbi:histidine phosphatase family protein [Corynebacterium yudongzhengii]|uniref:Histidine phosphatase family protein n=1 Tax=Corynebacterium yudongzhengii TaxID=2080740 RepID=A0A2U1T935_9CORY|nr:histidine phosphatase family protein [Corynebacterium yudongzhengii]AWB82446.1 histidine phosphatase family protein [Corynebacterium yudongzhengii]PWC02499.1 histidine phosphatase family protein [Corynebacterium yudongzhengii]